MNITAHALFYIILKCACAEMNRRLASKPITTPLAQEFTLETGVTFTELYIT